MCTVSLTSLTMATTAQQQTSTIEAIMKRLMGEQAGKTIGTEITLLALGLPGGRKVTPKQQRTHRDSTQRRERTPSSGLQNSAIAVGFSVGGAVRNADSDDDSADPKNYEPPFKDGDLDGDFYAQAQEQWSDDGDCDSGEW